MKEKRKSIFDVSDENFKARLIIFIAVFALAIAAFVFGVTRIGRKAPGVYKVEYQEDNEELVLFRSGITLNYRFEGSNSEIRTEMNTIKSLYSKALGQAYRLLDSENLYTGYTNIAWLNQHPGTETVIDEELFLILKDAVQKDAEDEGFLLFSGAYRKAWSDIVVLYDAEDFDPLVDENLRERLVSLRSAAGNRDWFSLDFSDDGSHRVRLSYSEDYRKLKDELEAGDCVLDLGLLRDAWMMRLVRERLEKEGFHKGYLESASGMMLAFSEWESGDYAFYGSDGENILMAGTLPVEGGSAFAALRNFAKTEDELGFYVMEGGEETKKLRLFRNPYFNTCSTEEPAPADAAFAYSSGGDSVQTVYDCMKLFFTEEPEEVIERAEGILSDAAGFTADCRNTEWGSEIDEKTILLCGEKPECMTLNETESFRSIVLK